MNWSWKISICVLVWKRWFSGFKTDLARIYLPLLRYTVDLWEKSFSEVYWLDRERADVSYLKSNTYCFTRWTWVEKWIGWSVCLRQRARGTTASPAELPATQYPPLGRRIWPDPHPHCRSFTLMWKTRDRLLLLWERLLSVYEWIVRRKSYMGIMRVAENILMQ